MSSDSPRFGARGLTYSLGDHLVLRGADLAIAPGEIHALVGMHNSGKSTLCRLLAGGGTPDGGEIVAAGRSYAALGPNKAQELGVFRVTGTPMVFPRLTVMENLVAGQGGWWLGLSPRRGRERLAGRWLREVGVELPLAAPMAELPREYRLVVDVLSRLFRRPELLLLDEVMEEIGPQWQKRLIAVIRKMVERGMSVVWVTQKIEDALAVADRISVMRQGRTILTDRVGNLERLNLVRLCYDQLDGLDGDFADREAFQQLMRYTGAMLNDLPGAVVVLDNELRARFVNRSARELLYAGADPGDAALPPDLDPRIRDMARRVVAGETAEDLTGVPLRRGGDGMLVDVRVRAVRENGVAVGGMVVVDDASLRESLRGRVMLSDKLATVGLLAAGVAHEVNNPLEIIGNYLNYLDGERLSAGGRKAVDKMELEVARIQQIIRNLVAYSGQRTLDAAVDPAELMRELVELLRTHMRPRDIVFSCEEPDGPLAIRVDRNELRQVFINLVRNSLDAMPDGGRIVFAASLDDEPGMARLRLTDSGGGIPFEQPNDIFLPFVTTKKDGGSHQGLGLYVVYGIVEGCGGAIGAENLPGGGCRFTVRLPLAGADSGRETR